MNVIVLSLQGCPLSALGFAGNEWIATPNLDRLASESIVFDQHISDYPSATAARYAWRSGRSQAPRLNPELNLGQNANSLPQPPNHATDLLQLLQQAGVHTVLLDATRPGHALLPVFYEGWSEKFASAPLPSDRTPMDAILRTTAEIQSHLAKRAGQPWLLWIELDAMLPPWDIPQDVFEAYLDLDSSEDELDATATQTDLEIEASSDDEANDADTNDAKTGDEEVQEKEPATEPLEPPLPWTDPPIGWFDDSDEVSVGLLQASLAAAMTTFDADLGRLFKAFRAYGWDQTATWIVTADYGFPLGEHGQLGPHRPWLHEELVHLPLVVRLPLAEKQGHRVPEFTQPTDLMPTILQLFHVPDEILQNMSIDGHKLQHFWTNPALDAGPDAKAAPPRASAISAAAWAGAQEWAIRTADWTLIFPKIQNGESGRNEETDDEEPRTPMLFCRPEDRWEVNDLYSRNLGFADELEAELREQLDQLIRVRLASQVPPPTEL